MKPCVRGCWLALIVGNAIAKVGAAAPECKLTGIVWLENHKQALLEIREESRSGQMMARAPILREGDLDGSCGVTAIDERSATVTLRVAGQAVELKLEQAPGEELAKRTFNFQSARLDQVLDVYQHLAGRTVIRPSGLPGMRLDLKSGPSLAVGDAAAMLARAFVEKGLLVKPRGDKFVFVVLAGQENLLSAIVEPPASEKQRAVRVGAGEEILRPGLIRFTDTDLRQVLDIYAELTGRTILQPQSLPDAKIFVRSQTPLTRKEAAWLLDALFSLAGVRMVPEGEKFVFAVPNSRVGDLPKFNPQVASAEGGKVLPPGSIKFQDAAISDVLSVYAAVLGREALPVTPQVARARFSLNSQNALSQAEAVFALEAVAALNNLRLERVGDDKVQIVPAGAP